MNQARHGGDPGSGEPAHRHGDRPGRPPGSGPWPLSDGQNAAGAAGGPLGPVDGGELEWARDAGLSDLLSGTAEECSVDRQRILERMAAGGYRPDWSERDVMRFGDHDRERSADRDRAAASAGLGGSAGPLDGDRVVDGSRRPRWGWAAAAAAAVLVVAIGLTWAASLGGNRQGDDSYLVGSAAKATVSVAGAAQNLPVGSTGTAGAAVGSPASTRTVNRGGAVTAAGTAGTGTPAHASTSVSSDPTTPSGTSSAPSTTFTGTAGSVTVGVVSRSQGYSFTLPATGVRDWVVTGSRQDGKPVRLKRATASVTGTPVDAVASSDAVQSGGFSVAWSGGAPEQDRTGDTTWLELSADPAQARITVPVGTEAGEVDLYAGTDGGSGRVSAGLDGGSGASQVSLPGHTGGSVVSVRYTAGGTASRTLSLVLQDASSGVHVYLAAVVWR